MDPIVAQLNFILAIGTIVLLVVNLLLLALLWHERRRGVITNIGALVRALALPLIFATSLIGSAITLVYSEIFGLVPCGLCWLQRIFLYPVVFLSGAALIKRDGAGVADYILWLSVPGLVVALYHHWIQIGGAELFACPTAGGDCARRYIFEFDFVTFPFMAAVLFGFTIVLSLFMRRTRDNATLL